MQISHRVLLAGGAALTFACSLFLLPAAYAAGSNVVLNPSLETVSTADSTLPDHWHTGNWGTNSSVFQYPVVGFDGTKAASITVNQYTDGDAKWYFDNVNVSPGDSYTFSDSYQSSVPTDVSVQYQNSSGALSYASIALPVASPGAWATAQATLTVPANVTSLTIFHVINQVGMLTIDNASLTKNDPTPPPADGNLAPNPTFAASTDPALPVSWHTGGWGTNQATLTYPSAGPNGTNALQTKITSYTNGDAKWYSDPIAVTSGTNYTWSDTYQSDAPTSLVAQFQNTNGSYSYLWFTDVPTSGTWTQAQGSFTVPANVNAVSVFHELTSAGTLSIASPSLTVTAPVTPPPQDPNNLIPNAGLGASSDSSLPTSWHKSSWGSIQSTLSYPVAGYNGSTGLKTQVTQYSSGDATWYFDSVSVTPGDTLVFTDEYQSNVPSTIDADFTLSNGTHTYADIGFPGTSAGWSQAKAVFGVPTGAVSVSVFHLLTAVGTLTTSNFSLTKQPPAVFSQGMVSFAFDDGDKSQYTAARPILNAAGYSATMYLVSGFLNTSGYMTTKQAKQLYAEGYEIGGHTRNHLDLTTLNAADLQSEVSGGRQDLIALGLGPVTTFTYPFGAYNDQVIQAVKDAGYTYARSVNSGFDDKNSDHYVIMDQHIENNTTPAQIQTWIDQAIAQKKWLILELHDVVANNPDQYSNSPAVLQSTVNYLKQQNAKVVTLAQGAQLLNP